MSAISNYLETAILNVTLRGVAFAAPANVYVALYTADPTDAGGAGEVSGGSYARTAVSTGAGFTAPASGATQNVADIVAPAATGVWGVITHVAIFDALTVGNLLYHGPLVTPKTVNPGDTFRFPAGTLIVSLN
jgi:hypothetical protein